MIVDYAYDNIEVIIIYQHILWVVGIFLSSSHHYCVDAFCLPVLACLSVWIPARLACLFLMSGLFWPCVQCTNQWFARAKIRVLLGLNNYILYGWLMRTVQKLITLFATLLHLLLLIVIIYDSVCTYDKTIIMDWYVRLCQPTCRICCHVCVNLFPPEYFLHYYSNHIRKIRWYCWLFYMMVSCLYRWLVTKATVLWPFVMIFVTMLL